MHRGSHETPGTWNMGALDEDLRDLRTVVRYLTEELGYQIQLLVGHSRGSLVGLQWMSLYGVGVRGFVNVSARYRMEKIYGATLFNIDLGAWKAQRNFFSLRH
jgi:uncharacterized protein